jgi:hypothetical protein
MYTVQINIYKYLYEYLRSRASEICNPKGFTSMAICNRDYKFPTNIPTNIITNVHNSSAIVETSDLPV